MKQDLRMNAKSPDPDDLTGDISPESPAHLEDEAVKRKRGQLDEDRSAPHIPPVERGRIRGEE